MGMLEEARKFREQQKGTTLESRAKTFADAKKKRGGALGTVQLTQKDEQGRVISQTTQPLQVVTTRTSDGRPATIAAIPPPQAKEQFVETQEVREIPNTNRPDLQSRDPNKKTYSEIGKEVRFKTPDGSPSIFISEESFKKTPETLARARGEQGIGITKSSYKGVAPEGGLAGTGYAPLSESEAKRITSQPLYKDPVVQAVGVTAGVALGGALLTSAVGQGVSYTAKSVGTSVLIGVKAPEIGENVSLLGTSKEDKKLIKSEVGQTAISYGLQRSSEKVSTETTFTGFVDKFKKAGYSFGSIRPGYTPGTFRIDTKTPEQFAAKQEFSGELRAFAEDLTVLAGDEKSYLQGVKEYASSQGIYLSPSQEQAFLKARTGRGYGQVAGAIAIGAASERLGQRFVAQTFLKSSSKFSVKEAGKYAAIKAGLAIAPAGAQEGASMYLLESSTRGFKPTTTGLLTSTATGAVFAGGAGGFIIGGSISKNPVFKSTGKVTDVVLNVLDPYEKAGDITYDITSGAFSKTFRTPVFSPTITKTQDNLIELAATKEQSYRFKAPELIKTEAKTTLERSLKPAKSRKRKPVFIRSVDVLSVKAPVEVGTSSNLFSNTKTDIGLKESVFPKTDTKTEAKSPVSINPITKAQTKTQTIIKPVSQIGTQTDTFVPIQPLSKIQTQTKVQTQTQIPVTTFDKTPPLPFVPFGGGKGRKGSKGKKPKVTGEAETLYRIFTGRAKAKKGLFGASSFNLRS